MSRLSEQVRKIETEIASMESRIQELEKPLEKPVAKDYSNSNDYMIAVRNHEESVRDRLSQIGAIEEFLPVQSERLKTLEVQLQAEIDESRQFYKALCQKADDFLAGYADVFEKYKSLIEFSRQRPQAWAASHPQLYPLETPGVRLEKIALLKLDSQERIILPGGNMVDAFNNPNNSNKTPMAIAG